jgi:hypothetical protein
LSGHGVNWTWEYFSNISGLPFKILKINQGKDDGEKDEDITDGMIELNLHGKDKWI